MIPRVHIRNFKTLKDVKFKCERMNLFIGDTNTGKSNILEALTLLSRNTLHDGQWDRELVRYGDLEDLFPLRDLSEPMVVQVNGTKLELLFERGFFQARVSTKEREPLKWRELASTKFHLDGRMASQPGFQFNTRLRRYQYNSNVVFSHNTAKELEPPYGFNLPGLLAGNKVLRTRLTALLKGAGVKLEVNLKDNTIRLSQNEEENVVVTLPYRNLSDTVKRYIFLFTAMETAKGYSLLLDEPEQNTFPFYTKHMAEMMAMDQDNQYFIATHNTYLFRSVVEKTTADKLAVFITHLNDEGHTQLTRLEPAQLSELLDMDIFFNLDRYTRP